MQSHANDDLAVTIGSQVRLYPKAERWRIEVIDPQTMKAVWITHDVLRRIIKADRLGAELVSGLAQVYRAEVEQHIRRAEMENWLDGYYRR